MPSTTNTVQKLLDIGLLKEITGQFRKRTFAYEAYMDILAIGTEPLK